jgi:acyl dehydratase
MEVRTMGLNLDAVGTTSEPVERSWTSKDALLYALGVGAGALDPTGFELDLTTENSVGIAQRVLPTFTTVVGQGGGRTSLGDYDPAMLVHGEQGIRLHGELPTDGKVSTTTTVAGMYDKGSAGLVVLESESRFAATGEPAFTSRSSLFIRGEGGFGGPRNPEGDEETALAAEPLPSREPDEVVSYATRPDQALLYRLSGDRNPLHSDPTFAKRAGFDRPILHGLCTYGFTGRALLHTVCASDPTRFGAMRARFSRPTMPGDTLSISVWDIGSSAKGACRFRTETQRGETVIDAGLFRLAG